MNNFNKPTIFWSWNNVITPAEAVKQVHAYAEAGVGGVFVHARNVRISYLGTEWFECFDAVLQEAEKSGIDVWIYDENGWPSGFGNGEVNSKGKAFQMKRLREVESDYPEIICRGGGKNIGLIVEENYVDLLNEEVVKCFIDSVHEKYRMRYAHLFGNVIKGIFTDEPQLDNGGFPYSTCLDDFFMERCGYPLRENLWKLFIDDPKYSDFKNDYFACVGILMRRSFTQQIEGWCEKNGLIFTGHFPCEESICAQPSVTGGVQGHYKYMSQPGIDFLGRRYAPALLMKQLCSVKNIYEKSRVLTESFAGVGNGVSFDSLLKIYAYQAVFGVNFLCMHLGGYSLGGIGKRDYPPSFSYQQPWWEDFKLFNREIEKMNAFVSEGVENNDILLISPLSTSALFRLYSEKQSQFSANYRLIVENLIDNCVSFDIFDEAFLKETKIEGEYFTVNNRKYSRVILPSCATISRELAQTLSDFSKKGKLLVIGALPSLIDGRKEKMPTLNYDFITNRYETLKNYLEVSGYERKIAVFSEMGMPVKGVIVSRFEQPNGDLHLMIFNKNHYALHNSTLKINGEYFVERIDADLPMVYQQTAGKTVMRLNLESGEYALFRCVKDGGVKKTPLVYTGECVYYPKDRTQAEENYLVVDKAYYSGDGFSRLHRIDLLRKEVEKLGKFSVKYVFGIERVEGIKMFAETLGGRIYINGKTLSETPTYPIDHMIPCYNVENYLVSGPNEVEILYDILAEEMDEKGKFETIANSRAHKFDLENLIFTGSFDVLASGKRENGADGTYRIKSREEEYPFQAVERGRGEKYFYRGNTNFHFVVNIPQTGKNFLKLNGFTGTFAKIYINGDFLGSLIKQPFMIPLDGYSGSCTVVVESIGSNRNLFGPFHSMRENNVFVGRDTFENASASFEYYNIEKAKGNLSDYLFEEAKIDSVKIICYQ
ncbi:MAG: hypothetical protein E7349_02235 [Clostridiales bacterium]|nr:hypothetical protein [Clostridiales bacterium]